MKIASTNILVSYTQKIDLEKDKILKEKLTKLCALIR